MADAYDAADNGIRGYWLAISVHRELRVRLRESEPRPDNERELRWAKEGVPYHWIKMELLDTVKDGK